MRNKTPIVVLALLAMTGLLSTRDARANPKDIPAGWHKVYQFNMIGYPEGQEYTGGCGQGNRVFVNRGARNARMLVTNGSSWDITDCNATTDNSAEMIDHVRAALEPNYGSWANFAEWLPLNIEGLIRIWSTVEATPAA